MSQQSGPVAQLGARFHGMEEVVGSNPTRSTIFKRIHKPQRDLQSAVDESGDLSNNAFLMQAPRFTFAILYRYWFTRSGWGQARIREAEM